MAENELKQYSLEEVGKHTSPDDLWMVILDKVYNVSSFLDNHPGGEELLIQNAGIDATEAFEDVGHSSEAREIMRTYLIGELREEDRQGKADSGPKSWSRLPTQEEGSLFRFWIPAALVTVAVSVILNMYLSK